MSPSILPLAKVVQVDFILFTPQICLEATEQSQVDVLFYPPQLLAFQLFLVVESLKEVMQVYLRPPLLIIQQLELLLVIILYANFFDYYFYEIVVELVLTLRFGLQQS